MFKLFERQPNWALKQLVQETDQPAVCLFTYISLLFCYVCGAFLENLAFYVPHFVASTSMRPY